MVVEDDELGGRGAGLKPLSISSTASGSWFTLAAITLGSVSVTIGCSWVIAALVCSGTDTAPIMPSAMSMVV